MTEQDSTSLSELSPMSLSLMNRVPLMLALLGMAISLNEDYAGRHTLVSQWEAGASTK